MSWKKFKYIYVGLFFIFLISGVVAYYWMLEPAPQTKPQIPVAQQPKEDSFKINSQTEIIFKESYKMCLKYNLYCKPLVRKAGIDERKQLNGLTIKDLKQMYAQANWEINEDPSNDTVTIIHKNEGLCPEHKKVWHLGLNNTGDYVAVYYGPSTVKKEGGIYKVTEIPIEQLSLVDQEKVKNFRYEFYQEGELVAILDSFSEFVD